MDTKNRMTRVAEAAIPGATIIFEASDRRYIRFSIEDENGQRISQPFPTVYRSDIKSMDDKELRKYLRKLCCLPDEMRILEFLPIPLIRN
jgi:hypothetical protein